MHRTFVKVLTVALTAAVAVPASAQITADTALALARAAAIAQNADFGQANTTVRTAFSDKVMALDLSDPYRLNGQVYWKTYTHYESLKNATTAQYSGIGSKVHATQADAPMASVVPDDLRPRVLDWLAYWDSQSSLDPELRVGARRTSAWGFYFRRPGIYGPLALIGVDTEGNVFRLSPNGPLVPWPEVTGSRLARHEVLFEQLQQLGGL